MGRVGAGDCGGGAPRPHGPMTSAGPTPDLPRPLSASRCLGRLWAATRREGSRARSLTPAGRAAKLLQLLIAMGGSPRASGRRARAIWALLCARALSGGAGALGSSVAAPNDARSTRRAAGCPPAPLGCVPAARGGSARPHSSSCPAGRLPDQRPVLESASLLHEMFGEYECEVNYPARTRWGRGSGSMNTPPNPPLGLKSTSDLCLGTRAGPVVRYGCAIAVPARPRVGRAGCSPFFRGS